MKKQGANLKNFIFVFTGLVLLIPVWFFAVSPVISEINELRKQIATIEDENRELERSLSRVQEIESEWEKWDGKVHLPEKKVPPESDLHEVFRALEELFADMPVDITGVRTGRVEETAEEQYYAKLNFDVSARAAAHDKVGGLTGFLSALEEFPCLLIIDEFTMQYGEKGSGNGQDGNGNRSETLPRLNLGFTLFMQKSGTGE